MSKYIYTFIAVSIALLQSVYAKDLGVYGEVHKIAEADIVTLIQNRLTLLQKNGELIKLQEKFAENSITHAHRPKPVEGISTTKHERRWLFDPSITLNKDIIDNKGNVIAVAGTHVNPLEGVQLTSTLVFFNGDNEAEVAWAKKFISNKHTRLKIILVNGSIKEQTDIFKREIYFDQAARLVTKFSIKHTPATIKQEGLLLRISEVMP